MLGSLLETVYVVGGKTITELTLAEGLIYALIGFIVTFIGIVILIFFVWLVGRGINFINAKSAAKKKEEVPRAAQADGDDEIGIETKLAIIAAIAAYYEGENSTCEFKVKRIKRI